MIDLALETDFGQLFIQPSLYPQDEHVLLRVLRHPRTMMTFSDSGAHLSQIADSSIHTYLLGYWVRQRQEFTLEEAVRMLTLAPAVAWGSTDRGLLREGMAADLNVFDPRTVGPAVPTVVSDLPAGGNRLDQRSTGFRGHRRQRTADDPRRATHRPAAGKARAQQAGPTRGRAVLTSCPRRPRRAYQAGPPDRGARRRWSPARLDVAERATAGARR